MTLQGMCKIQKVLPITFIFVIRWQNPSLLDNTGGTLQYSSRNIVWELLLYYVSVWAIIFSCVLLYLNKVSSVGKNFEGSTSSFYLLEGIIRLK
jgi:hypothetical protein